MIGPQGISSRSFTCATVLEVEKLKKNNFVREVQCLDWLANVVVLQKKNGKLRVCNDFTDLNKACSKDSFMLPKIDIMVDEMVGHEIMSFMDAYLGYNKTMMHLDN